MEIAKIIGWIALGFFCVFIFGGTILHILGRRVVPNRYEWLQVLSHTEWKTALQLRYDMEKLKGTSRGGMNVYTDLDELYDEKLVGYRMGTKIIEGITSQTHEYRLTAGGIRKKSEIDSQQKNEKDFRLQPALGFVQQP